MRITQSPSGQEGITGPTTVTKGIWFTFHKPDGAGSPEKTIQKSLTQKIRAKL